MSPPITFGAFAPEWARHILNKGEKTDMNAFDMTPRRLFEMGMISEQRLRQLISAEEFDAMVIDGVDAGIIDTGSDEYANYYDGRMSGRWDINTFSPETRERFGWNEQDDLP